MSDPTILTKSGTPIKDTRIKKRITQAEKDRKLVQSDKSIISKDKDTEI